VPGRCRRGLPGDRPRHRSRPADLTAEAIRLTLRIRALMPGDGEVVGLLALMLLTEARRTARVSASTPVTPVPPMPSANSAAVAAT